jgi:hypothetical protein
MLPSDGRRGTLPTAARDGDDGVRRRSILVDRVFRGPPNSSIL